MPRRLLNIASIVCLVAGVALMGMWVRSRNWVDELRAPFLGQQDFELTSRPGRLLVTFIQSTVSASGVPKRQTSSWSLNSARYGADFQTEQLQAPWLYPAVRTVRSPLTATGWPVRRARMSGLVLSYWFLALVSGSLAMAFQLRWPPRFTLRSLFIATTFLAIVLGMIA